MEREIPRLLLSAPASGSGKTTMVCALLRAAQRQGLAPCAFKCGPDYIDPMFHREALGIPSRNLDLFFSEEAAVRRSLSVHAAGHGIAVLEGVMGLYDGIGVTEEASSWHLARVTETPILLVVRPKGTALTLAALLKGLLQFRTPSRVGGILLNGCSASLAAFLTPVLERELEIPVLGWLPELPECAISSRNLGLLTPEEVQNLEEKLDRLADQAERTIQLDRVWELARTAPPLPMADAARAEPERPEAPVLAVARDRAFCFYYEDNLEQLRQAGLRLAEFSPIEDKALPEGACGLYLGGGYPELYAQPLSENKNMRRAIFQAIRGGMPALAECGGFLYLQKSLEDDGGRRWPMAGVLEGEGYRTDRLRRFGYVTLKAERDGPYFRAGETIRAHEFHRWDCTKNGNAARAERPNGGREWDCMVEQGNLLAGFPHLYFPSHSRFAPRFAGACVQYKERIT